MFLEAGTWETHSVQKFANMKETFPWTQKAQPYVTIIEESTAGL